MSQVFKKSKPKKKQSSYQNTSSSSDDFKPNLKKNTKKKKNRFLPSDSDSESDMSEGEVDIERFNNKPKAKYTKKTTTTTTLSPPVKKKSIKFTVHKSHNTATNKISDPKTKKTKTKKKSSKSQQPKSFLPDSKPKKKRKKKKKTKLGKIGANVTEKLKKSRHLIKKESKEPTKHTTGPTTTNTSQGKKQGFSRLDFDSRSNENNNENNTVKKSTTVAYETKSFGNKISDVNIVDKERTMKKNTNQGNDNFYSSNESEDEIEIQKEKQKDRAYDQDNDLQFSGKGNNNSTSLNFDERNAMVNIKEENTQLQEKLLIKTKRINELEDILQNIKKKKFLLTPSELITNLEEGLPAPLEQCKTLESKQELLFLAVETYNSELIIKVLMFLLSTVKKKRFYDLLRSDKTGIAKKQYLSYRSRRGDYTQMEELYAYENMLFDRGILRLRRCLRDSSAKVRVMELDTCEKLFSEYSKQVIDGKFYQKQFADYKNLIVSQTQIKNYDLDHNDNPVFRRYPPENIIFKPLRHTLHHLCVYHYSSSKRVVSPNAFVKAFSISKDQYVTTALWALAKTKKWKEIKKLVSKGTLSGKYKTPIGFVPFVAALSWANATKFEIKFYVDNIHDQETKYRIALEKRFYNSALDAAIQLKSKQYITKLKEIAIDKLTGQDSVTYITRIDKVLDNPKMKWKN
ncbi:defective spermatogenesis protein [Anaeramoeba flamelloides]|uniref:Defective spermatogenesis protein n=1 Tax=Anaeramoeba flamelloides TaxID=1746091 RepID=A0AAV7ZKU3_9EUKA|nr:defective spermatogenesis protein [Anaeramoeba flamelloides]